MEHTPRNPEGKRVAAVYFSDNCLYDIAENNFYQRVIVENHFDWKNNLLKNADLARFLRRRLFSGCGQSGFFYCPGCSPIFQTLQSIRRVKDFYEKTGVWAFESRRLMNENGLVNLFLSDRVVVLGNEFTVSTTEVGGCRPKTERVNLFYFDAYDINPEVKNYAIARKHLVWFGSLGRFTKGWICC